MPKILVDNYSQFYDRATKADFRPVLDQRTGCYVGIADVSPEVAKRFKGRKGFHVLTKPEWDAINEPPAREPDPEPEPSATGDPLRDQGGENAPPPPPSG